MKAASKRGAKWKLKDSSACAILVKRIVEFHVRSNKTYVYRRYRSACEKYKGMGERQLKRLKVKEEAEEEEEEEEKGG